MKFPLVSVVIATYNSGPNFSKVLRSIRNQNYPKSKIEILVIDGNSTDGTIKIAKKFKCKILKNPKRDQVYGKFIGYQRARGKYIMLIDSDEVLVNKDSIKRKVKVLSENNRVKAIMSSGYIKPLLYPSIIDYINEFGDPFSLYMYRSPRNSNTFIPFFLRKYKALLNDEDKAIFDFKGISNLPFIELTSMAVLVDKNYIKKNLPSVFISPAEHTHLFYLLNEKGGRFVLMKKDPVVHYSVKSWTDYLRKIRSRITSNIFYTEMGKAGFRGRESFQVNDYRFKKYLFIVYGLTIIPPIIESLILSFTRRKTVYLTHAFLTYYTCFLIIFFYTRKLLHINTKIYTYGGK